MVDGVTGAAVAAMGDDSLGGGADTLAAGTGADTLAGGADTTPAAYAWDGLDEELKGFVGTMTPNEIAREGYTQKQAASRRTENFQKESGLLSPPEEGKELDFFAGFAPDENTAYADAAKDVLGDEPGAAGEGMMNAAKAAGLHPKQFNALMGSLQETNNAAMTAQGEAFELEIKDAWGADRVAKSELVQRAAKEIAPDLNADEVIGAVVSLGGGDAKAAMRQLNVLAALGGRLQEGVTGGLSGEQVAVQAADERAQLRDKAISVGGVENLPSSDVKRLRELQEGTAQ